MFHIHKWSKWEGLYRTTDMVTTTRLKDGVKTDIREPRLGAVPIAQGRKCLKCGFQRQRGMY